MIVVNPPLLGGACCQYAADGHASCRDASLHDSTAGRHPAGQYAAHVRDATDHWWGPQMEEPTTGPLIVDGSNPETEPGQPTRPEPPDPLQPIPGPGTIAERSEKNIQTYEDAQAAKRQAYEEVLAAYTALRTQPGAQPAAVQEAYDNVVKAYGEASKDIMEAYRSALTEWSGLMVAWQAGPEVSPGSSPAPGTTSGSTPTPTGAASGPSVPGETAPTTPGAMAAVPSASTVGKTPETTPQGPVGTTQAPPLGHEGPATTTPGTPAPASETNPASSLGASITSTTVDQFPLKKDIQHIQIVLGGQTSASETVRRQPQRPQGLPSVFQTPKGTVRPAPERRWLCSQMARVRRLARYPRLTTRRKRRALLPRSARTNPGGSQQQGGSRASPAKEQRMPDIRCLRRAVVLLSSQYHVPPFPRPQPASLSCVTSVPLCPGSAEPPPGSAPPRSQRTGAARAGGADSRFTPCPGPQRGLLCRAPWLGCQCWQPGRALPDHRQGDQCASGR